VDTTQLLKGVLDLAVLAVVQHEDGYGYDVVRRLRASGLQEVGDASVYGTLRRLYSAGALSSYVVPSDEGPHRKYYGINANGRKMLAEQSLIWGDFADTMNELLSGSPPTPGAGSNHPAGPADPADSAGQADQSDPGGPMTADTREIARPATLSKEPVR